MRQVAAFALGAAGLLLGAAASLPVPLRADADEPFTVGVLRRDGVVMPLAAFSGRDWSTPWPLNPASPDVPISLELVPRKWWGRPGPVTRMTAWADGEPRGVVQLGRPLTVDVMCSSRLGLSSDYATRFPVPAPDRRSFPKDGLVVSGPAAVGAIERVPPESPEWTASAALLAEPFDAAEARAADAFLRWKHPVPRAVRRTVPLVIDALYKAPMDAPGWTAYRFQALKRYPPAPAEHGCGPLSSASGWIASGPPGRRLSQITVRITYCDRMDDLITVPLGQVVAGGRSYWVYQLSGYDREGYVIARPRPKAVETPVQYEAGSCPD